MTDFELARSTTIQAPAAAVHALINDFHEWFNWSPWEGVDPDLQRTYTGPDRGVGAAYAWTGNRKAGRGSMQITDSTDREIRIRLDFVKPFKASNDVTFVLEPDAAGAATRVTWQMTGKRSAVMSAMNKVLNFDKLIGGDFEKGLQQLKERAESGPPS
ncbi:MAG TPA: SRPBCC family protein [Nakamurella sp.]